MYDEAFHYSTLLSLIMQDGIIDYNEFVAMMRQGNGGIGRKSLTGSWTSGNLFRDLVQAGLSNADEDADA